ncbi:MAG TPA: hypothetical protein VFR94_16840 [Nitrososphaeraceae archaeon]|nr:hypothetical protein [Nitrososphaeraceae archaeon]
MALYLTSNIICYLIPYRFRNKSRDKNKIIKYSTGNNSLVFLSIAASILYAISIIYTVSAQTDDEMSPADDKNKYFVAKMRADYDDQDELVKLYSSHWNDGDIALSHPNEENLEYTMQLPGEHGVQYFSLSEIKSNVASLKAKGVDIVSLDLEKEYSSNLDLEDPVASVKAASEIVHKYDMKFMISPSIMLTADFGTQFAPFVDIYNIQAQSLQSRPNEFNDFVKEIARDLRSANPEISISTQVSTARGSLDNMKRSISSVVDIVDGISSWFTDDRNGLNKLNGFIRWFNNEYRQE